MAYRTLNPSNFFWLMAIAIVSIFVSQDASAAYQDASPADYAFQRHMSSMTTVENPGGVVTNTSKAFNVSSTGVVTGGNVRVALPGGGTGKMASTFKFLGKVGPVAAKGIAKIGSAASVFGLVAFLADACLQKTSDGFLKLDCFPGASSGGVSDGFVYIAPNNAGNWASAEAAAKAYAKKTYPNSENTTYCGDVYAPPGNPNKYISCYVTHKDADGVTRGPEEFIVVANVGSCPAGKYMTTDGCTDLPPEVNVSESEVVDAIKSRPATPGFLSEVSKLFPVPIEPGSLVINGGEIKSYPVSSPQAVPNTSPQQYQQRLAEVKPDGTLDRPLRVDTKLTTKLSEDPNSIPEDGQVKTTTTTTIKTEEPPDDLCIKNPEIVACSKLGTLEPDDIKNTDRTMTINKSSGFGPENGTCPAPKSVAILGQSFSFSTQPLCDFALMIRPLFIAFAWFSAALVFFGFSKKD